MCGEHSSSGLESGSGEEGRPGAHDEIKRGAPHAARRRRRTAPAPSCLVLDSRRLCSFQWMVVRVAVSDFDLGVRSRVSPRPGYFCVPGGNLCGYTNVCESGARVYPRILASFSLPYEYTKVGEVTGLPGVPYSTYSYALRGTHVIYVNTVCSIVLYDCAVHVCTTVIYGSTRAHV